MVNQLTELQSDIKEEFKEADLGIPLARAQPLIELVTSGQASLRRHTSAGKCQKLPHGTQCWSVGEEEEEGGSDGGRGGGGPTIQTSKSNEGNF